jgi:hypothetical protein
MRAVDGAWNCLQAAMQPITKNGRPVTAPKNRYSSGSNATASAVSAAAMAKLIHHDERSSTANSEFVHPPLHRHLVLSPSRERRGRTGP